MRRARFGVHQRGIGWRGTVARMIIAVLLIGVVVQTQRLHGFDLAPGYWP